MLHLQFRCLNSPFYYARTGKKGIEARPRRIRTQFRTDPWPPAENPEIPLRKFAANYTRNWFIIDSLVCRHERDATISNRPNGLLCKALLLRLYPDELGVDGSGVVRRSFSATHTEGSELEGCFEVMWAISWLELHNAAFRYWNDLGVGLESCGSEGVRQIWKYVSETL